MANDPNKVHFRNSAARIKVYMGFTDDTKYYVIPQVTAVGFVNSCPK